LHHRISDFFKEIDDNINMNYTFSIEDIGDDQQLDLLDTEDHEYRDEKVAVEAVQEMPTMIENKPILIDNSPQAENALLQTTIAELPKFRSLSLNLPST
jgi:hypothetical protein